MNIGKFAASLACVASVAGCAQPGMGSGDYRYYSRGQQTVRFGVVESVRDVRLGAYDTGVGTATGAVLGGIAGSHAGRGNGEVAGAIAGMVIGGIIGQNVEQSNNERPGLEITVQLDSGKYLAVVQAADEPFRTGDRVRVLSAGRSTRVTH